MNEKVNTDIRNERGIDDSQLFFVSVTISTNTTFLQIPGVCIIKFISSVIGSRIVTALFKIDTEVGLKGHFKSISD